MMRQYGDSACKADPHDSARVKYIDVIEMGGCVISCVELWTSLCWCIASSNVGLYVQGIYYLGKRIYLHLLASRMERDHFVSQI